MSFLARMQADGWTLLEGGDRNELLAEIAPNGDGQYRRGVVTLSLSNGTIHEGKHGVTGYFDENGLILNAILVERDHRHQGHGRRAMESLIAACNPKNDQALRLKLEAGFIGRGFIDETRDLDASALVNWYQELGFVLDKGSVKCMEYKGKAPNISYDFGAPVDNEPEWKDMRVDSIAAHILSRLSQAQMYTCVRAISNAYYRHSDNFGVSNPDPVAFLRYNLDGIYYQCEIFESEDESGNFDGAIIKGVMTLRNEEIKVLANSITIPLVSEVASAGITPGTPATRIVDAEVLKGRVVEHAVNSDENTRIMLKSVQNQLWEEICPGWT